MSDTPNDRQPTPADIAAALKITPLFYDAALDPRRWDEVFEALCDCFAPTRGASLILGRSSDVNVQATFSYGFSEEENALHRSAGDYQHSDPRTRAFASHPNKPHHRREITTTEEFHGSPFYKTILRPANVEYSLTVVLINEQHDSFFTIGVLRGRESSAFTSYDVKKFQLIVPHLRRAAEVYARLTSAEQKSDLLKKAFDDTGLATFFADKMGTVIYANKAGKDLIAARQGVALENNILCHRDDTTNAQMLKCIRNASSRPATGNTAKVQHISLPRESRMLPLQATVCSLAAEPSNIHSWISDQIHAAVFITDPLKSYESNVEHLQRLFGLTVSEAKVLSAIASGSSTKDIAEETSRSVETVRRHLKNVMAKTGTNRQAELVRLVLSMSPGVDT